MQTCAPQSSWLRVASSVDGVGLAAIGWPMPIVGPLLSYTGSFYSSTNSGATWISNNMPSVSSSEATSYSLASSADGWMLAALITYSLEGSVLFTSTNSGAAWITNNLPKGSWNSVAFSADGTRLIVGGFRILVSTNSGNSWMLTNSLAASCVVCSADGAKCAAISGSSLTGLRIYVSTNSGAGWVQTGAPSSNWLALASSADGSRLAAVAGNSSQVQLNPVVAGPIYTSVDGGGTWVSNHVAMHNWISVAASADGCKLVAADAGPRSTNAPGTTVGGGIWTAQISPTPSLNLTPANGNLTVSWIVPSINFVLQQSSDLSSWLDMTNPPVLNLTNLQNEVVLAPASSSVFYRLRTP